MTKRDLVGGIVDSVVGVVCFILVVAVILRFDAIISAFGNGEAIIIGLLCALITIVAENKLKSGIARLRENWSTLS